jgi:hypothetical protein
MRVCIWACILLRQNCRKSNLQHRSRRTCWNSAAEKKNSYFFYGTAEDETLRKHGITFANCFAVYHFTDGTLASYIWIAFCSTESQGG